MTCRCRAQFCYMCGLKWPTCTCTNAGFITMQQRTEIRRADGTVRTARANAEAEETAAAIRAVEAFMRAEEERMAREIEAEQQRAEAQRRREEDERRRRDEARIAAVNRRFRQLGSELEELHDVQRVLMAERYEFETELLQKERQDALDTLSVRHPTELQHLANESASKARKAEHRFETDYAARLEEEQRIEDTYVLELREFWKGKPDGEYRVRSARDELRRDQDKGYRFWDQWRRTELEALREGERRKMETLRVKQEAEVKTVDGRARIEEVEWRRKRWAEEQWVVEIVGERSRILGEEEGREYGRGVEIG